MNGKGEKGAGVDETKMSGAISDWPTNVKAAKVAKKTTSSVSIQESIVVYVKEVASCSATKLKMHGDNDERWQTFFDMQKTKIKAT